MIALSLLTLMTRNLGCIHHMGLRHYTSTAAALSAHKVHLTYYGANSFGKASMLISWATCDSVLDTPAAMGNCTGTSIDSIVAKPLATAGIASTVYWGPKKPLYRSTGAPTSYVYSYAPTQGYKYASPLLHHVLLTGGYIPQWRCFVVHLWALPWLPSQRSDCT